MGLTSLLSRGAKRVGKFVSDNMDNIEKGADFVAESAAFLGGAFKKEASRHFGLSFLTRSGNFGVDLLGTSAADIVTATAVDAAGKIVKESPNAQGLIKYSLTGFGKSAFIGAGIIGTAYELANYRRKNNGSQVVSGMTVPQTYYDYQDLKPSFNDDNTGASGDLVFALNNLR